MIQMGEIRSSFQRRKKSASVASSASNNTPPTRSMETSSTTPQPPDDQRSTDESPQSPSERSNTGSREPRTPSGSDVFGGGLGGSRILFHDVPLTGTAHTEGNQLNGGDVLAEELHIGPSENLWPESQMYTTNYIQPESRYFSPNTVTLPQQQQYHPQLSTRPAEPHKVFQRNDSQGDPMQYLLAQEKGLNLKLQELLSMHMDISMKGMSTQRVRKLIGQEFKSLSLVYEAMRELYEVQYKRRGDMLRSFETWESEKKLLIDEVKVIRSLDNEEGRRLVQLKEDELSVDEEIKKVEQRLAQLKDKKSVLRNEIDQVESVIESRSSSHMEQLRDIEKSEKMAIVKLSEEKSIVSQVSQMNLNEQTSMLGSFLMRFGAQSYVQPVTLLTPDQVMEVIKRQLDTFQDAVDDYLNKGHVYQECLVIWEDTSEVLATLEKDLTVTLKSQTSDSPVSTKMKIESLLLKALETLQDRMISFKGMNDVMKTLLNTEISTLQKGIELLDPKKKTQEFKPSPLPAHAPTFLTTTPAEPVLSQSPPNMASLQPSKSRRSGSIVGNRLKDNLSNMKRSPSVGTTSSNSKAEKTD